METLSYLYLSTWAFRKRDDAPQRRHKHRWYLSALDLYVCVLIRHRYKLDTVFVKRLWRLLKTMFPTWKHITTLLTVTLLVLSILGKNISTSTVQ